MNNTISIKAPAISNVDQDGVKWTFDPQAQKWTASLNGKKFHSQDYDKVREKMAAHRADLALAEKGIERVAAVAPPRHTVEVGLLSVSTESNHGQSVDMSKGKIKINPITVKIEWDVAKGEPTIVRYKGKDGGWASSGSHNLVLLHPNFMDAGMRKFFERFVEGKALGNAFRAAEQKIAEAWWSSKEETSVSYSLGQKGFVKDTKVHQDRYSSRGALLSGQWPATITDQIDNPSFEEWTSEEDGSLRRGSTVVRMVYEKSTYNAGAPRFEVVIDGSEEVVFKDADLRTALIMGNATHEMLCSATRPVIKTWQAGHEWSKDPDHNSWPRLMEVEWSMVLPHRDSHRSHYQPMAYVFGRFPNDARKERAYSYAHETDPHERVWHRVEQNSFTGKSYRPAGPEDAVLGHMEALRTRYKNLAQEHDLDSITREDFAAIFKSTLADVYNAAVDGEDEISKDPQAAKAAFDNILRSLVAKVNGRDLANQWEQVCNEAVEQAQDIIANPVQAASKPRKPR